MAATLRSYAKINLGLGIGPVRADGFHMLATVYQTVDVWDVVTVSAEPAAERSIVVRCADSRVPCDARNTAWQAAARVLEAVGCDTRVEITIDKRLPVQGGLGAGSANAAAAMLGLEQELARMGCGEALTETQRLEMAAAVGSDVPLFLVGGASMGSGRGELVTPLEDRGEWECVIAVPETAVSTPQAFRDWDARAKALTAEDSAGRINELSRKAAAAWARSGSSGVSSAGDDLAQDAVLALVRTGIENDFEQVVFPQHSGLRDLKAALAGDAPGISNRDKAWVAMLSGSGASLFGLYGSAAAADAAAMRVTALGAQALRTRTLSRARYWQEMQRTPQGE